MRLPPDPTVAASPAFGARTVGRVLPARVGSDRPGDDGQGGRAGVGVGAHTDGRALAELRVGRSGDVLGGDRCGEGVAPPRDDSLFARLGLARPVEGPRVCPRARLRADRAGDERPDAGTGRGRSGVRSVVRVADSGAVARPTSGPTLEPAGGAPGSGPSYVPPGRTLPSCGRRAARRWNRPRAGPACGPCGRRAVRGGPGQSVIRRPVGRSRAPSPGRQPCPTLEPAEGSSGVRSVVRAAGLDAGQGVSEACPSSVRLAVRAPPTADERRRDLFRRESFHRRAESPPPRSDRTTKGVGTGPSDRSPWSPIVVPPPSSASVARGRRAAR